MYFTRSLAVLASVALVNAIPVPQDAEATTSDSPSSSGTSSSSNAIKLVSESDFCLFLPPQPGLEVATNEDNGIPFCSNGPTDVPGAKPFPDGFITVAHYQQNGTYQQVTGYMNPSTYQLSSTDQGGQYDNHGNGKPVGASCQGYNYFVSIIEPANNRYCIRCCQDVADCNTGRSGYGCLRVVPGDYTQADGTQPSDAASASSAPLASSTATDAAAQPTDNTTPSTDPTDGGDDSTTDDSTDDHSDATLSNNWAEDDVMSPGVDDTGSNPSTDNTGADTGSDPTTGDVTGSDPTTGDVTGTNPTPDTTGDDNGTNSTSPVSGIVSSEFPAEVTSLQALLANGTSAQDIQQSFQQFVQSLQTKYPNAAEPLQQLVGLTGGFTTTQEWQNFVQTLQTKIANAGNGGSGSDAGLSSIPPSSTPSSSLPVSDASLSASLPTDAPSSAPSSDAAAPTATSDPTTDGDAHDNVWIAEDDVTGGDLSDPNASGAPPSDAPSASLPTSDSSTDSAAPSATPTGNGDDSQPLTAEQLDQELDSRFDSLEQKIMDELRALLGNNTTSSTEHNDHNNQAA